MSPILPSACTYVVPRKKTCRHPCKLVTRKNKPQCRTKYLKKKKPKGTKRKRKFPTSTPPPSSSSSPSPSTSTPTSTPTIMTPQEESTASDPLKSMVNILSKRVSFFQKPKPV